MEIYFEIRTGANRAIHRNGDKTEQTNKPRTDNPIGLIQFTTTAAAKVPANHEHSSLVSPDLFG